MNLDPKQAGSEQGLLLVGHGTRDVVGQREFLQTAESVAGLLRQIAAEACFLELAEPSIDEAVERLAERGIERLTVMPLLLFAAGHAKRDIPQAVENAIRRTKLSDVLRPNANRLFEQISPLECHPQLLELSALRFDEAVAALPAVAASDTALVMVGRGSRDAEATAAMVEFARRRGEHSPVSRSETCFVAMSEPLLPDCLEQIAAADLNRVVVQPHLLFGGQLQEKVTGIVEGVAKRYLATQWVVTRHLGPHALLDAAIVGLVTRQLRSDGAEPITV